MPDKTLTCRDCGRQFPFTQGEQDFYASRGFTNEPTRCPDCRAIRKSERGSSEGGGYTSGGYSSGGGYGRREMYPATCAECGKSTQVPFMPRGDRPVYCSDCFERQRGGGGSYSGGRGGGGGGRGNRW